MLQLKQITKTYTMAGNSQHALQGIDLAFRDCEFVSVLGPSGSGKTTLLNIVGGLDRYSDGDLLIDGRTTKRFRDRDWDSYRNHAIGFIFQSYHLITHQTALANVELAMTLSGISKGKRRKMAKEALTKVGLAEHMHKRPGQMSGGQQQRVAIARALVNDPKIILADEPTGALDSETSVQIMELLKEIARERLVIMVTHNPELAQTYSSRIIQLRDGRVVDDTDPFEAQSEQDSFQARRTGMGFITALALSWNNLLTKKGRTLLTAFAGSIGIIGIALILSLSTGVQSYIDHVQEETLVAYPLTIEEQNSANFFSVMNEMQEQSEAQKSGADNVITSNNMVKRIIATNTQKNDLTAFYQHIQDNQAEFEANSRGIHFLYALTPQIYKEATDSEAAIRVNPASLQERLGKDAPPILRMFGAAQGWLELAPGEEMREAQYTLVDGAWPGAYNEVVLIADENNRVSDYILYSLDIKPVEELKNLTEADKDAPAEEYSFDTLSQLHFRLLPQSAYYQKEGELWLDKRLDSAFLDEQLAEADEVKIVGIIRPKEGTTTGQSAGGIGYTQALTDHLAAQAAESDIVKEQLADPTVNVLTGRAFDAEQTEFVFEEQSTERQAALMAMTPEAQAAYIQQYNQNIKATYEDNLLAFGMIDMKAPAAISFYSSSFEEKEALKQLIADYNTKQEQAGEDTKVLRYTDQVALLMSSVTTIIRMITYVLIGFVAISLIVSSIMIGIITYISVLERTKEIGILRAMGASKWDIARIFMAETAIEGVASGALGIGITLLLNIPISSAVEKATEVANIASLSWQAALGLIVISIVLTVIAGILPSRVAAKKDPVEALRTE
ncbi:MAG: ABC transporter ATP-binding protein/permease [Eubacteriales bacterium]|nr:ABC transporter ATP-binding protein/permease [Eubacteriales bacterium]